MKYLLIILVIILISPLQDYLENAFGGKKGKIIFYSTIIGIIVILLALLFFDFVAQL